MLLLSWRAYGRNMNVVQIPWRAIFSTLITQKRFSLVHPELKYQKREKNRHELFLLSSKNHITFLDRATVMRQKTNGIHICLSALKTGLAVPDEMIFMAKTVLGRPFNFYLAMLILPDKLHLSGFWWWWSHVSIARNLSVACRLRRAIRVGILQTN